MGFAPRLPPWQLISPSYLPQLVDTALDLLIDGEQGIWHLAPCTPCSLLELARRTAAQLRLTFQARIAPSSIPGDRGPMRALASERGWPLPDLDQAIEAYARQLESRAGWQRSVGRDERCPTPGSSLRRTSPCD
jgi:dTDP-4-dehydrorhamnose reductase